MHVRGNHQHGGEGRGKQEQEGGGGGGGGGVSAANACRAPDPRSGAEREHVMSRNGPAPWVGGVEGGGGCTPPPPPSVGCDEKSESPRDTSFSRNAGTGGAPWKKSWGARPWLSVPLDPLDAPVRISESASVDLSVRVRVRAASDLPPPALRTIVPCGGAVGTPSLAEAPGPVVAVVVGPRP